MFFFRHHSDSARRSRMTARVNCVLQAVLNGSCHKRKVYETQAVPGHGESVSGADERGKYEQKGKKVSYKTAVNTCLSFLNEVKNLAKDTRFKYSNLCTPARPYRLARLGTSLGIRGKLTLRKKKYSFYYLNTLYRLPYAGFFAKSQIMFFLLSSFRFCPPLKNDGRSELRFDVVLNDFLAKKKRI